jgi:hypothetical protein
MNRRAFVTKSAAFGLFVVSSEWDAVAKKKHKSRKKRSPHQEILANLAAQHAHGNRDNLVPLDELEARLAAGERIEVTCTIISVLAQRRLRRARVPSRLVLTMTRGPYDDLDNGHTMIEVKVGDAWSVYDLDGNRRAVDSKGGGVSVVDLCKSSSRRWQPIAYDPAFDDPKWAGSLWSINQAAWDDKVMGVPLIEHGSLFAFRDEADRARIEAYAPTYRFVSKKTWQKLTKPKKEHRKD